MSMYDSWRDEIDWISALSDRRDIFRALIITRLEQIKQLAENNHWKEASEVANLIATDCQSLDSSDLVKCPECSGTGIVAFMNGRLQNCDKCKKLK